MSDRPHWPRDAPIRWGWFVRGLTFQAVAILSVAANLLIGVAAAVAIAGDRIDGVGEWLLAVTWGIGAIGQFYAWWLHRRLVVAPPLVAGALLVLLVGLR